MSENEKDQLIKGHDYDGIQELNNPLPGWWLMTFYITIVFAVVYYSYYTFFGGPTLDEELAQKMSVIQSEQQMAEEEAPVKSNVRKDLSGVRLFAQVISIRMTWSYGGMHTILQVVRNKQGGVSRGMWGCKLWWPSNATFSSGPRFCTVWTAARTRMP